MPLSVIDQLLADIQKATTADIVQSCGTTALQPLLNVATTIFEQFPAIDQMTAMAVMAGMLGAFVEGSPKPSVVDGHLISWDDRLRIFEAIARQVYTEAMVAAAHPDCPAEPASRRTH